MRQGVVRGFAAVFTTAALIASPVCANAPAQADDTAPVVDATAPANTDETAPVPASDASNERFSNTSIAGLFDERAKDLFGFMPSLYTGKWFMPGKEPVRRCIIMRESHANYRSTSSIYHGAYQMTAALGDGAAWMMQREVKHELGKKTAVKMMSELRRTPVEKWNRYWQDRAFWTIWRHGAGAHHWGGGSHSC